MEDYCVLDGGFATELMLSYNFEIDGDPLWSARLIGTHSDIIKQVHTSYLKAGADLIETATYQASISGFVTHLGVTSDEALDLMRKAVNICKSAVDEFWQVVENRSGRKKPLVVGSLGPYGAHLVDRSEYNGHYIDNVSTEELIEWHRPQVNALIEAGVDMLAFETIPAQKEAEGLVQLLREFPSSKAWISFSCKDDEHTCHGENISEAAAAAAASDQVVAVGINCTQPEYISNLLRNISDDIKRKKSIVVYPNSGEDWSDASWPSSRAPDCGVHRYVDEWAKLGAKWFGGCCCVSPRDIALIRSSLLSYLSLKTSSVF